jgi:hypothetical protein
MAENQCPVEPMNNLLLILTLAISGAVNADDPTVLLDDTKSPRNMEDSRATHTRPVESNYEKNFIYRELGLKEGDVIKSVNDKKIDPGDMDIVSMELRTLKPLKVVINRKGKEMIVRYPREKAK